MTSIDRNGITSQFTLADADAVLAESPRPNPPPRLGKRRLDHQRRWRMMVSWAPLISAVSRSALACLPVSVKRSGW